MDPVAVARLERDWRRELPSSRLAHRLRDWQAVEPALRPFGHPAAVLRYLRRSAPGEAQDRVLRALLSCAADDAAASRLLLHALLPGLKRLSARLLVDARDQEELWSALLAALGIQVAQALVLTAAVNVFLTPDGRGALGLSATGGLVDLLVVLCLLWILIRIPFWAKDLAFSARPSMVTRAAKTYVFAKVARAGVLAA